MPFDTFTDSPLWKEASALADSVLDFSRGIEDFSLRNRMTNSAIEIPFLVGEAAQSQSEDEMKSRLWKVEDPVNELRSVLTESKEQGFAPGADFELMQDRCRNLFQKVHMEASRVSPKGLDQDAEPVTAEESPPEIDPPAEKINLLSEQKAEETEKTITATEKTPEKKPPSKSETPPTRMDDDEDDPDTNINAVI